MITPIDYELPHQEFRLHQDKTIERYFAMGDSETLVTEQCTGSGKSATAMALASKSSVVVLTESKSLQDAYGNGYGADLAKGKSNYRCIHPSYSSNGRTVADCPFADKGMKKCQLYEQCEYVVAKRKAQASPKAVLNYHYWFAMRNNWPVVNYLVMDEAHNLSKLVTDHTGCTITERDQKTWNLPEFPELRPTSGGGLLVKVVDPLPQAVDWLEKAREVMRKHWKQLQHDDTKLKQKRQCERLGRKMTATLEALYLCPDDWFVSSGKRAQRFGKERRPAFVCKPLTAKHHAPGYFGLNGGQKSILMSATIGEFSAFAEELGIERFDSLVIPNQYPAEARQIYVLDCPSMGAKAKDSAFEKQADEIARAILDCPKHWSGLVLVTRKSEAKLLAERLARRGLQDRIWVTPGWETGSYEPTDQQVIAWNARRKKVSNSICCTWSFHTGYDGLNEQMLFLAKIPYPLFGSPGTYEAAWRSYSAKRYKWATANAAAQSCGRTRRGREIDYDLDGEFRGFVAICDGSYKQIRKYLPEAVKEALVE